ncbi:MAG TPA: glycosyltransferase family 39 protein [Sedimentisphaerales bacterium]|nr:glycosyltransferase family 39 protein [Sedimentisphaerales bacterium]
MKLYTEIEKMQKMTIKSRKIVDITVVSSLIVCLGILAFLFQGSRGIWQPDEGYYAGTAVTMMSRDSLLIPYLGEHEIFLDKPPMIYWGIMGGLKLFGHNEFGVRFFHGLCFILTSLAVGSLSYSMFKNKGLALLSSLIYATMAVPFIAANFVTPDTILTLWTTLSALCFWNSVKSQGKTKIKWQMFLCAAVGLGFLAKGPAILIPCGAMFVFLLVRKETLRYFLLPWSLLGILIFIATGLSWYIWIGFKLPGAFSYFIDNQIMGRLITEKYNRNPGLIGALIYVPVLVFGSMPWSTMWWENRGLLKSSLLSKRWLKILATRPESLFLLCYFFVPLLVLCLASSKLGFYALPIFVPLAIATAKLWIQKAPAIDGLSFSSLLKSYARPIKLTTSWVIILLIIKLGLAYYPTHDDMRTLSSQIKTHLPSDSCELCTVDERADGLLFYGLQNVEHLTNKSKPYPTFTKTETIMNEIHDFINENESGVLLIRGYYKITEIIEILKKAGIDYRLVELSYNRALLFPCLTGKNSLDTEKI